MEVPVAGRGYEAGGRGSGALLAPNPEDPRLPLLRLHSPAPPAPPLPPTSRPRPPSLSLDV